MVRLDATWCQKLTYDGDRRSNNRSSPRNLATTVYANIHAPKAFDTFEWGEAEDETNIEHVLAKFDAYYELRTQVIYERYRFNPFLSKRFPIDE